MPHSTYLCTCISVGCGEKESWSNVRSQHVKGAWISKALFYRHQRLDRDCLAFSEEAAAEDGDRLAILRQTFSTVSLPKAQSSNHFDGKQNQHQAVVELGRFDREEEREHILLRRETRLVEEAVIDLKHMSIFLNQIRLSFSSSGPLSFLYPPNGSFLPYAPPSTTLNTSPNDGPHRLRPSAPENSAILAHEDHLFRALVTLEGMHEHPSLEKSREDVVVRIRHELRRVEEMKAVEWERQRIQAINGAPTADNVARRDDRGAIRVNSDRRN
ncbi:hypothetical protein BV22DRAFT_1135841 [Leucogyrophana mollusca]|uniref:Uncharacterized protein n=1 Tax=Leucogyrophana mollusca TaxID=85980 RepID=A0ACB8AUD4_9AGAM|nr:hypothetical protein BV22DRAFT_1135841 [Leucogyrophana mollusca]